MAQDFAGILNYRTISGKSGFITLYMDSVIENQNIPEPRMPCNVLGKFLHYAALGDVNDPEATPLRVHRNSDGKTYAVLKQYTPPVPTGKFELWGDNMTITIPNGVTVLQVNNWNRYIGVTPNKTYNLDCTLGEEEYNGDILETYEYYNRASRKGWVGGYDSETPFLLKYSPEINKQTPTVKDY